MAIGGIIELWIIWIFLVKNCTSSVWLRSEIGLYRIVIWLTIFARYILQNSRLYWLSNLEAVPIWYTWTVIKFRSLVMHTLVIVGWPLQIKVFELWIMRIVVVINCTSTVWWSWNEIRLYGIVMQSVVYLYSWCGSDRWYFRGMYIRVLDCAYI